MASALFTAALPLVVYFFSGRLFVRGVLSGAVKG
jgi:glucose/mannose transport system permease protein